MIRANQVPWVSAIIPTRDRPELVLRAVRSVLGQTCEHVEAIVVVDGPDPATIAMLEELHDPRVRVISLEESVGGGEARNIGVAAAAGQWIALLDDDDEWLPEKVSAQLLLAAQEPDDRLVVASNFISRRQTGDLLWPVRPPRTDEPISEYLFSDFCGYQTSTYLCSRRLFLEVPFTRGMKGNQDLDWLLRIMAHPGVRLRVAQEPLSVYHVAESRASITRGLGWQFYFGWGRSQRHLMTARAYSLYVSSLCATKAALEPFSLRALLVLLLECLFGVRPNVRTVVRLLARLLLPEKVRYALGNLLPGLLGRPVTACDRSIS
jgi:glycosyltransferase involved in cell wall biosynthesis